MLTTGDDQRSRSFGSLATVDGGGRQRARVHRPYLAAGPKGRHLFGSLGRRNGAGSRCGLKNILGSPCGHSCKRAHDQQRNGHGRRNAPHWKVTP
ncbi:hypothetical protein D3C73_1203510 [compost metagenome]